MKSGNLEMISSSGSLDTCRSLLCFLNGFYKEREWLEAYEVKQYLAYGVNHNAYLLKTCRCDDACIWYIFDSLSPPSNAAVRNITLNASIMGQNQARV
jgi:hypothetical protein